MKVLHITSELDGGGVDRLLLDYCTKLNEKIRFDFIVTSKFQGMLEEPLVKLGSKVYHLAQVRDDFKLHCNQLRSILENNRYDIVHDHSGYKAFYNLIVAKSCGVKKRIAHSHLANVPETKKSLLVRELVTPITKYYSTDLFACGRDAGHWMWGNSDFYVMKNAINTNVFKYNHTTRIALRDKYHLTNKFVIGNVARFTFQKNHEFLIKMFFEFKKMKNNAVLVLVGQGENETNIKEMVVTYNLQDSVIFMGVRNNVPDLLNMFDIFVLPSRYEGLPVTLVEVQANGLLTFCSNNTTSEIKVSDFISYLDLKRGPQKWAEFIFEKVKSVRERKAIDMSNSDYDINKAAELLYLKYNEIISTQ